MKFAPLTLLAAFVVFLMTLCVSPLASAQTGCYTANFGAVGLPFDSGLATVAGGTAPYTYSVLDTLPSGLTLNTATGEVSGTPTSTATFNVQSKDALGVASTPCLITIGSLTNPTTTFGIAIAYNLVALTGDISNNAADITGRIAAAGQVTTATTIGSDLRTSDPYISLAAANSGPYAIVAAGGIPTSSSFNVNAGGSVYSSTSTTAGFNFANEQYIGSPYAGSQLITGGTSPINFSSITSAMTSLSTLLSGLNAYGVVCSVDNTGSIVAIGGCPTKPIYFNSNSQHYNPSWIVLYGTNSSVNVFQLTADQLQTANFNLDIEVPTGSTVIINATGAGAQLTSSIYFQGNTVTDANAATILFNFPTATSVAINGQFDGVILAPHASLCGTSQMGGVFIAASIGSTGEVHYVPFSGWLPWSSTTSTLAITCAAVSTGITGIAFDSGPMAVSGGSAPYVYSIVGTLPAGLVLNTATGEITGTPSEVGTFQVRVTDSKGVVATTCAITINLPLSIICPTSNTGTVGVAYNSGPISISGGTGPYTFSVVGILPAGLWLNPSTGVVAGTPTAAGNFSIKVTDASGNTATSCNITIIAQLSMTCPATNTGTVGVPYNSGPMSVTGGVAPYKFSYTGTLPTGLSVNSTTGAVTGTPTTAGTFWVVVTDANGNTTMTCDMTISSVPLTMTCPATNTGTVGVYYNSGAMSTTGGLAPYKYSYTGTLPTGLSVNPTTGAVTGTPTTTGTFWVVVTDANGSTTMTCDMTISASPLTIVCPAINSGTVGVYYNSGPMFVTGGVAPYKYSYTGTLPTGLSVNPTTGAVTGTPTSSGTFWVVVTDANGSTTMTCDMTIKPAPLAMTCPVTNTGTVGVPYNSGPMSVSGGTTPYKFSYSGSLPNGLWVNPSTGAVTGTPTSSGTFWVVVTDANWNTTMTCDMTINPAPLVISSTSPAIGEVQVTYVSAAPAVSGGTGPYTYSVVGTLPAGLTFYYGQVFGVATAPGTFAIKVTDALGRNSVSNTVTIKAEPSIVNPGNTIGVVGVTFDTGVLTVSGGIGPFTFSVVGTLPAGLSLNSSTGEVRGTPAAPGSFLVMVIDLNGRTAKTSTMTIGTGYTLSVNPSSLTVTAGQSATTTFTFAPYGGYTGIVSFTCSGLPTGSTCTFLPPSLTANGSNSMQNSTLTIKTTSSGVVQIAENKTATGRMLAAFFFPGLFLGGIFAGRRRRLHARVGRGLLLLLFGMMLFGGAVGCGGDTGIYQNVLGSHLVTVVGKSDASSGTDSSQIANFTLTIVE